MAKIHRASAAVLLCCITFVALILVAPAAAAAGIDRITPTVAPTIRSGPIALASTGLDITMPVVIGLGTLILGIVLVAWAFLRTGRAEHR